MLQKDSNNSEDIVFYTPTITDIVQMIEIQKQAYIKNYVNEKYKATAEQILNGNWELKKSVKSEQLQNPDFLWIGLKQGSRIIGYGCLGNLDKEIINLYNIIVDPDFQGQGYGSTIVNYLLKKSPVKRIELETTVAVDFYKKLGFESKTHDRFKMYMTVENLVKLRVKLHKELVENPTFHNENINFLQNEIRSKNINNLKEFEIEFFASSQCNDLYLVTAGDHEYLARITNWEQNKVWKIKQEEYQKLKFIEHLKISPLAYYYDIGENKRQIHWSLIDFIEGQTVKSLSNNNIIQLAQILNKLHSNTVGKEHGDRWNSLETVPYRSYVLEEYSQNKPKFVQKVGYENLKQAFESINWQEIKQFCFIHNDLKPLNMVEDGGKIKLIDWEYSFVDIPENDVARLFIENKLNKEQKDLFLQNYLTLSNLDFRIERLEVLAGVYEFFEVGKDAVEPIFEVSTVL